MQECAKWMKDVEIVADEFATRKIRQYVKLGYIKGGNDILKAFYKNIPESHFIKLISQVRDMIKKSDIKSPEEISELFYNWIKAEI
jgi:tRNA threonylcarbamoyladenosine modification (KEOPS) complex Cgi121 subunit